MLKIIVDKHNTYGISANDSEYWVQKTKDGDSFQIYTPKDGKSRDGAFGYDWTTKPFRLMVKINK